MTNRCTLDSLIYINTNYLEVVIYIYSLYDGSKINRFPSEKTAIRVGASNMNCGMQGTTKFNIEKTDFAMNSFGNKGTPALLTAVHTVR